MDENKQDPTQQCAKILSNDAAKAMVLSRYSSTPEEAKKWGYVKNIWEDQRFQDERFKDFIKKAMKADPWKDVNGKEFF